MPELPEVETVRQGLARHLVGRTVVSATSLHPRVARRHALGGRDLCERLTGCRCLSVERRGKYLWIPLKPAVASSTDGARIGGNPIDEGETDEAVQDGSEGGTEALIAHLGMSGQFRFTDQPMRTHPHLRFDAHLDDGQWLSFLDQRTFGGLSWDLLDPPLDGRSLPASLGHIAPDPFESGFDVDEVVARVRRRRSEVKRVLLDQTVVSGVGNIYADEALWRARVHPARAAHQLAPRVVRSLLAEAQQVMADALEQGGTSFDALYVNVNGESGYFERSLAVYGREGQACRRCGAPIRRLQFMNRSSFVCQRCQRPPRLATSGRSAPIG
ncbi:MAG: bifunctional DNA-formamidopyrimidine glycosylase/DNA-(apurinic or apyrimidinic site) lyase [Actinomycetes bacterium]